MSLFKSYTYNWKQIGIFKLALIAIGMMLGAYFSDLVQDNIVIFAIIAVAASIYTLAVSLRQVR